MDGDLPVNHAILGNLQDVFNLLPNLATPPKPVINGAQANGVAPAAAGGDNSELARAMSVKTNDQLMAIYLSSLIRAITAFHDLIENKIQNRQQQDEKDGGEKSGDEKKVAGEKKEESGAKKTNGVNGEAKESPKGKDREGDKKGS